MPIPDDETRTYFQKRIEEVKNDLTLEKLGIKSAVDGLTKEVANLSQTVAVQNASVSAVLESNQRELGILNRAVKGNGDPGLMTRMRIQEENEKRRSRWEWIIFGLLTTMLANMVYEKVSHNGSHETKQERSGR